MHNWIIQRQIPKRNQAISNTIKSSYESDIWAVGIAKARVSDFLSSSPAPEDIVWIEPDRDFSFIADPHGIWHEGKLYMFVEALDYRVKKGVIDCFVLDADFNILDRSTIMEHKDHLSYPFIIKDQGEIYMIPESSRSGDAWIYRAVDFPTQWEKVQPILPGASMIDASLIQHDGLWWMFYTLPGAEERAFRELHVASADSLLGTWTPHKNNPVSTGRARSRPGGRPFLHEGKIHLPVQGCSKVYGGSLNILRIDTLTLEEFSAEIVTDLQPVFHPKYPDGLHTLSACGAVTLIDCKYIDRSARRKWINLQRRLGRFLPWLRRL